MIEGHFKASGNTARLLGEQLVSNKFVALLELIKNAYDADATDVSLRFQRLDHPKSKKKVNALTVEDNGHGMLEEDILNKWLLIGTNNKERAKVSPSGRRYLGAKGIGRFAFQKLCHYSNVVTIPDTTTLGPRSSKKSSNSSFQFEFDVDWRILTSSDQLIERYKVKIKKKKAPAKDHGCKFTLFELQDEWSEDDIDRLIQEISALVPPKFSSNFNVKFSHWKFRRKLISLPSTLLGAATYTMIGTADGKKTISYTIDGQPSKIEQPTAICGPFDFEIYAFDTSRFRDDLQGRATKTKRDVREFHGIKLYRDEFRVKPYGDPGTDWIGLDKHRINRVSRLSSDQVIGIIRITSDKNAHLVDQTNREGIMHGEALVQLREAVFQLVNKLSVKNVDWHSKHSTKQGYAKKKTAAKKAAKDKESSKAVKELIDTSDKMIRQLEETNADLRANASIGLAMLAMGHDLLEETKLVKADIRDIQDNISDKKYLVTAIASLRLHADIVHSFAVLLEEFGRVESQEISPLNPNEIVKNFSKRFGPLLKREENGVKLKLELAADSFLIQASKRDLESILINLTTNAVQAMQGVERTPQILIQTVKEGARWCMYFSDAGQGIPPSVADDMFRQGVTTKRKEGGSGLGLFIVQTIVKKLGGTVDSLAKPLLGGATFVVRIPVVRSRKK